MDSDLDPSPIISRVRTESKDDQIDGSHKHESGDGTMCHFPEFQMIHPEYVRRQHSILSIFP